VSSPVKLKEEVSVPAQPSIENCQVEITQNCTICDRPNATMSIHTQPRSKIILENGFSTKLDFENFSFFPVLAALALSQNQTQNQVTQANSNSSMTIKTCQICHANLKIQWNNHEQTTITNAKNGKKHNKKERWLRTYFVNEAKCGACGEDKGVSELKEVDLGMRVPKIFIRGLCYGTKVAVCGCCFEGYRKEKEGEE